MATWLSAQGTTATVQGTVADPSGAAIAGAEIQVKNMNNGAAQTLLSDAQGRYTASNLGVGNYDMQAFKTGFATAIRRGITLTVGAELVIDFSLQVGQQSDVVTVEGQ